MKKILRFFVSYKFALVVAFVLNIALYIVLSTKVDTNVYFYIEIGAFLLAAAILLRSNDDATYKILWMLFILVLPLFGSLLCMMVKGSHFTLLQRKQWNKIANNVLINAEQDKDIVSELETKDLSQAMQTKYILDINRLPVVQNSFVKYFDIGEKYFEDLFEELKKAKKFILMQYFIIKPGKVWDELLQILKEKAAQGVEVKILYDDFGCMDRFKFGYFKSLKQVNIQAKPFNKIRPTFNQFVNYRDHRKIAVVDGSVAFTGGVNIGDEYANIESKFGHWKDTGIKIEGDAVWNFTLFFFTNWKIACKKKERNFDVLNYKIKNEKISNHISYIQPFISSPLTKEPVARNNYLRMIHNAKEYIYIVTPYLIIDSVTIGALKMSAQSGVDVRILMPGVPDKKLVYYLGRSYYKELLDAGIKIYEYTPGFIHAKMVITDDKTACIGTINFDFRSLFLHFENAVLLYNDPSILDMKQDIESTFAKSHIVNYDDIANRRMVEKFVSRILKIFAPLM